MLILENVFHKTIKKKTMDFFRQEYIEKHIVTL